MPGGTVSSSAAMLITPRSASRSPEPALHGAPVALHLALGLDLLAPEAIGDRASARRRARPRASPRGCAQGRWTARPCAARRRRSAVRWPPRRSSCRRRPCRCRGSSAEGPWVGEPRRIDRGQRSKALGAFATLRLPRTSTNPTEGHTLTRFKLLAFALCLGTRRQRPARRRLRGRRRGSRGRAHRDVLGRATGQQRDDRHERSRARSRARPAATSTPRSAAPSRPSRGRSSPSSTSRLGDRRGRGPERRLPGWPDLDRGQPCSSTTRHPVRGRQATSSSRSSRTTRPPGPDRGQRAAFQEQCQTAAEQGGIDASLCDTDPFSLLTNLENEGDEDVEGTETIHVHGRHQHRGDRQHRGRGDRREPAGAFLPPEADRPGDRSSSRTRSTRRASTSTRARTTTSSGRFDLNIGVTAPESAALSRARSSGADADALDRARRGQRAADDRGAGRRQAVRRTCSTSSARAGSCRQPSPPSRAPASRTRAAATSTSTAPAASRRRRRRQVAAAPRRPSDAYLDCIQNAQTPERDRRTASNETQ